MHMLMLSFAIVCDIMDMTAPTPNYRRDDKRPKCNTTTHRSPSRHELDIFCLLTAAHLQFPDPSYTPLDSHLITLTS